MAESLQIVSGQLDMVIAAADADADRPHYAALLHAERRASAVATYHSAVVPGLLQVPEYAYAISNNPLHARDRIVRGGCYRGLLPITALIGAQTLRRTIGDAIIMQEQLDALVARMAADDPLLQIRIVPEPDQAPPAGLRDDYVLLDLAADGASAAATYWEGVADEGQGGDRFSTDPTEIARSVTAWQYHSSQALGREASLAALREAAAAYW